MAVGARTLDGLPDVATGLFFGADPVERRGALSLLVDVDNMTCLNGDGPRVVEFLLPLDRMEEGVLCERLFLRDPMLRPCIEVVEKPLAFSFIASCLCSILFGESSGPLINELEVVLVVSAIDEGVRASLISACAGDALLSSLGCVDDSGVAITKSCRGA